MLALKSFRPFGLLSQGLSFQSTSKIIYNQSRPIVHYMCNNPRDFEEMDSADDFVG